MLDDTNGEGSVDLPTHETVPETPETEVFTAPDVVHVFPSDDAPQSSVPADAEPVSSETPAEPVTETPTVSSETPTEAPLAPEQQETVLNDVLAVAVNDLPTEGGRSHFLHDAEVAVLTSVVRDHANVISSRIGNGAWAILSGLINRLGESNG